jgi:hypothetical protein
VLARERVVVVVGPDARHQLVAGDTDEHEAAMQEGEPAEHLLLSQRGIVRQGVADAICE